MSNGFVVDALRGYGYARSQMLGGSLRARTALRRQAQSHFEKLLHMGSSLGSTVQRQDPDVIKGVLQRIARRDPWRWLRGDRHVETRRSSGAIVIQVPVPVGVLRYGYVWCARAGFLHSTDETPC